MVERVQRMYLRHTNILTNFIKVSVDAGKFCLSRSRQLLVCAAVRFIYPREELEKKCEKLETTAEWKTGYTKNDHYTDAEELPTTLQDCSDCISGLLPVNGASLLDILILKNDEIPLKLQV